MNIRAIENATLGFLRPDERGSVQETVFPWDLTIERWKGEGFPADIADRYTGYFKRRRGKPEPYFDTELSDCTEQVEEYFGLDPIKRIFFRLPLSIGKRKIANTDDWRELRKRAEDEIAQNITDDVIEETYSGIVEGHQRGDFSVRISILGFFWIPRTLFGIEEHLYAFYDHPQLMHEMNQFVLDAHLDRLGKVLDLVPADVVYIQEDLSGSTGPMLSPQLFDEFVGASYLKLVPFLRAKGVTTVLVDTDGDFTKLIPNFIDAGIDGFLPLDVNAGVDIVKVREQFPRLRFIGGFNKLSIAAGKDAIDREFERLMPVIRQGGYIPGCDHQVAPATSLNDYLYYISRLREAMKECGKDLSR